MFLFTTLFFPGSFSINETCVCPSVTRLVLVSNGLIFILSTALVFLPNCNFPLICFPACQQAIVVPVSNTAALFIDLVHIASGSVSQIKQSRIE